MSWEDIIKTTPKDIQMFIGKGIGYHMVAINKQMDSFEETISDPELKKIFAETKKSWASFYKSLSEINGFYYKLKEKRKNMREELQWVGKKSLEKK